MATFTLRVNFPVALLLLALSQGPLLAQPKEVILLRHGDKLIPRTSYNLSPKGLRRAIAIGRLLPACFGPIDQIGSFMFRINSQKNARSYQSAVPLAVATGINIILFTDSASSTSDVGARLLQAGWAQGQRLVLFWEHRRMPALAKALGWAGMPPIADDDFGGLYQLRYTQGTFRPEVSVSRQSDLFQQSCFIHAKSTLPVVPLP